MGNGDLYVMNQLVKSITITPDYPTAPGHTDILLRGPQVHEDLQTVAWE